MRPRARDPTARAGSRHRAGQRPPTELPRRVGAEHVAQVRELVSQAYRLDHRWGGGQVREMLGAQMRRAVGLLDAHADPAVSHDLYSAVGWLAQGDPAEAVTVATSALDHARTLRSQRIIDNLTELQRHTAHPRHRSVPGIAPLQERITQTLAA